MNAIGPANAVTPPANKLVAIIIMKRVFLSLFQGYVHSSPLIGMHLKLLVHKW